MIMTSLTIEEIERHLYVSGGLPSLHILKKIEDELNQMPEDTCEKTYAAAYSEGYDKGLADGRANSYFKCIKMIKSLIIQVEGLT